MAASKCLVAYGDKNVVVTFHGPWTKENLTEHIKTSKPFEGLDFSAMSLKVFDKDFEMYVDIDDDFVIPDKARLLIKETSTVQAHLEFHLLTKVQLVDALQHSFAAAAAKIVDAARKKRHLDGFMKELVDRADYALEAPKNNDVLLTAAVCVLPSLVKERMEAFICPEASNL
ncbi:hypothetical protein MRX96_047152 [Rhipicephalus microplus]